MNAKSGEVLMAIPARGGSKRLKRKNLLPIGGKPMVAHTILAALESGLSKHVYVCTEDDEIAVVAKKFGAKVFPISEEMAGDLVSSTTPCLKLAEHLASQDIHIEFLFNLQPSSPLRNGGDIRESLSLLRKENADYLVSATPIDPHYFHWALQNKAVGWEMYFGTDYLKERPLLPPVLRPNGAIKLARLTPLKATGNFFGKPLAILPMPEERGIHVAADFDYVCAKAIYDSGVNRV